MWCWMLILLAPPVLTRFRRHSLHLISRVRCSTVAHAPFSTVPTIQGPGRPRQWGSKVKLQTLFAPIDQCQHAQVWALRATDHRVLSML